MILRLSLCAGALILLIAAAAGAAPSAERAYLPVSDIHPGMQGYGLTVLHGTRVDTFAVRVLGVQQKVRPAGSIILVELSGLGLEVTAIPQGMSGSPVFLEGKLAGAVAFGWAGALSPIAGLTPAEEILDLPATTPAAAATELAAGGLPADPRTLLDPEGRGLELVGDVLGLPGSAPAMGRDAHPAWGLTSAWPEPAELGAALLQAVTGGRENGTGWQLLPTGLVYSPLGGFAGAAAGAAASSGAAPSTLVPGSACAVPLVLGDAQMGAIGTATWVDGDQVYLMGHPFMQQGAVSLPLAGAEIFGVFPSRQISFKLGTMGPVVGSVYHDLRAGLSGRLGAGPELTPLHVKLERPEGTDDYSFELISDPRLTPALSFWALYNALLVRGDDLSLQSIRYRLRTHWRGPGGEQLAPVDLNGAVAGPGSAMSLAPDLMAPLQILMTNRHEPLALESVEAVLSVQRSMETAVVAAASAPEAARAGQSLNVEVTLQPRRAPARTVTRELALPDYLPPGLYRLVVANGRDMFALEAERAAARFQDRSLAATLDLIRAPRDAATLVLALISRSRGVLVNGLELPDLPGSVDALLRRDGSGCVEPTAAGIVLSERIPTELVLQGHVVRDLIIQKPMEPSRKETRP